MCKYVNKNICTISKEICPFVYYCNKVQDWKPLKSMPEKCNIIINAEVPKGYYRVRMERKGYLYIDIKGQTYKILNPFDDIPLYVKAVKLKSGKWKLRK